MELKTAIIAVFMETLPFSVLRRSSILISWGRRFLMNCGSFGQLTAIFASTAYGKNYCLGRESRYDNLGDLHKRVLGGWRSPKDCIPLWPLLIDHWPLNEA